MKKAPRSKTPERPAQANYNTAKTVSNTESLIDALVYGGVVPRDADDLKARLDDGKLIRFPTASKPSKRNGWLVVYFDGGRPSFAVGGDWAEALEVRWSSKAPEVMTEAERARERERVRQAKLERDRQQRERQSQAAAEAREIWKAARPADPAHPYLVAKAVHPFSARQRGGALLLPLVDFNRNLTSLQFINAQGTKLLFPRGRKRGCFIPVARPENPARVLICEGWSTGATLAESNPADVVLAAVDAGNLKPVATGARNQWPDAEIVVCGDDDRHTPGNPGYTKAREAAIAAGALMAFPQWPPDAPESLTDFNDLANWQRGRYDG